MPVVGAQTRREARRKGGDGCCESGVDIKQRLDACVPYTDNEMWTSGMGYTVDHDWHPWFYSDKSLNGKNRKQLGGYSTRYASPHNFTFITIRGGRHEVPETAPKRAFEMLRRLLNGLQF